MAAIGKISRYLFLPLAAVLVAVVLLGYWLIATESGTHRALRWFADSQPGLEIGQVSGTLLNGVSLENLDYMSPGFRLDVGSATGAWNLLSVLGGQFQLDSLQVSDVRVTLEQAGDQPDAPAPWPSLAPPFPVAIGDLSVRGVALTQAGREPVDLGGLEFSGAATPLHYRIKKLVYRHPAGAVTLSGRLFSRFPYGHELTFDWWFDQQPHRFTGTGSLSGRITGTTLEHMVTSPDPLRTEGTLGLENRQGEIRLAPALVNLELFHQWPQLLLAVGDTRLVSTGELSHSGTLADYSVTGNLVLERSENGTGEPVIRLLPDTQLSAGALAALPVRLDLDAAGSASSLAIAGADLDTGTGSGTLAGTLSWAEGLAWDLDLTARQLDLAVVLPRWPAVLSGDIASSGFVRDDSYSVNIETDQLEGSIEEIPLNGRVTATVTPGAVRLPRLSVRIGDNRLEAEGTLGREHDIRWELEAPQLAALGLGVEGALSSRGSFAGTPEDPRVQATVNGTGLAFREWEAASVDATLSADAGRRLTIEADAGDIAGPGLPPADIAIRGSGTLGDHRLEIEFANSDLSTRFTASGGYDNLTWKGDVQQAVVESVLAGTWRQSGVAKTRIGAESASVGGLCLLQDGGRVCLNASRQPGELRADASAEALPLAPLERWLPEMTAVAGTADGSLQLTLDDTGSSGRFSVATEGMDFSWRRPGEKRYRQPAAITLDGSIGNDSVSASGNMTVGDIAAIDFHLETDTGTSRDLRGTASLDISNLQWLEAFTALLESPAGRVQGELDIAGTRDSPTITGTIRGEGLAATLSATGVELRDGEVSLALTAENTWRLDGRIAMGKGEAIVSGEGLLSDLRQQRAELALTGTDLDLIDLPDTRIRVSPDVTLTLDGNRRHFAGTIGIPYADITLKELPRGAVGVSNDEVVDPPLERDSRPTFFTARLEVQLGNEVHIAGYGLDTYLAGKMTLRRQASGVTTARGRIDFRKGTYEAYGQELKITHGQLVFQGDLENPGVNFRAVRETPTADVGLRITGVLKDFSSEVFSDPPLPPTDALIVLVTGKPPGNIDQSEANLVVGAAAALGLSQSERITSRLQSSFGLDVLALEGGDTYEDSSLVVGKQIAPGLFVSYVQNLFSPASSFILEYQLTERLNLKAESGEYQSLDLLYKIEH